MSIVDESKNEMYEYEFMFLNEFMQYFALVDKTQYEKIMLIGDIAKALGKRFDITDAEFVLAGYYSNTTLLPLSGAIREKSHLEQSIRESVKRHVFLSYKFLLGKQLNRAAELAYYHHELPNGKGYLKKQTYPIESNLIHIADMFVGMTSARIDRLGSCLTGEEAVDKIVENYKKTDLFSVYGQDEIIKTLEVYF